MPQLAYSYIRFSTKKQLDGDSLDRQLALARAYAAKHSLILDESSYRDLGLSAFRGKNATDGALKAFLDAVDAGVVPSDSILLIEAFDRLSRAEVVDALDLFLSITKRGITLITLNDGLVYNRQTILENWTKLVITIASMAKAHLESSDKSTRIKSAARKSLAVGKKHAKCPFWLEAAPDRLSFIVKQREADIVREVFEMRANTIGSLRIAKHLNTTYGWKWGSPQVSRLLQNPAVIGTRISQAGYEPVLNYYTPVVDKVLYYDVQKLMKGTPGARHGQRPPDELNLFTGLLYCGSCGSRMRFTRANKYVAYSYVNCMNAHNGVSCANSRYINYDALEKEVIGWLLLDQDEEVVALTDRKPKQRAIANAELQALKEQQSRLIDLAASGIMNPKMVAEKLNALEMQIQHFEAVPVELVAETDEDAWVLVAEKTLAIVERLEDATLAVEAGEDPAPLYEVRRELKAAFQRSIERITVFGEQRTGETYHGKFAVRFRGWDGEPSREYKRPALTRLKGVWNGR